MTQRATQSAGLYDLPTTALALAARLGLPVDALCKLDANESSYGPPPAAIAALASLAEDPTTLTGIGRYPDPGSDALRGALEGYTGLPADQIVVGNGLDEVLHLLAEALLSPGDEVVVAEPTFDVYSVLARQAGARVVDVGTNDHFQADPERLAGAIGTATRLVMLCSPNNPTGTALPREALLATLDRADQFATSSGPDPFAHGPLVVMDEAYHEFGGLGGDPAAWTALPYVAEGRQVVVLRTFSKIFGLAGLRVGYAVCPPGVAARLRARKQPYNANIAGQAAARAALGEVPWLAERARRILAERTRVAGELAALDGLRVYPAAANFLLVELVDGPGRRDLIWQALLDRGVLVRRTTGERVQACLRITIGTREQNDRLLDALRDLLSSSSLA